MFVDDTEGWETVQGFGRRKYRHQGGSGTPPTTSSIGLMIKNTGQKVMALHTRNEAEKDRNYDNQNMRPRANSRESEKENQPSAQTPSDVPSPLSPTGRGDFAVAAPTKDDIPKIDKPIQAEKNIKEDKVDKQKADLKRNIESELNDRRQEGSNIKQDRKHDLKDDVRKEISNMSPSSLTKHRNMSPGNSKPKDIKYESERKKAREHWPTPQTNKAHDIFSSDDEKEDETEDEDLARRLDDVSFICFGVI